MAELFENSKWIGAGGAVGRRSPVKPAPYFRKPFVLDTLPEKAQVWL